MEVETKEKETKETKETKEKETKEAAAIITEENGIIHPNSKLSENSRK